MADTPDPTTESGRQQIADALRLWLTGDDGSVAFANRSGDHELYKLRSILAGEQWRNVRGEPPREAKYEFVAAYREPAEEGWFGGEELMDALLSAGMWFYLDEDMNAEVGRRTETVGTGHADDRRTALALAAYEALHREERDDASA